MVWGINPTSQSYGDLAMRFLASISILSVVLAFLSFYSPEAEAFGGYCRYEGNAGTAGNKGCFREDCEGDGPLGHAVCTIPKVNKPANGDAGGWTFGAHVWLSFGGAAQNRPWCEGNGGTWNPNASAYGQCIGPYGDIWMWGANNEDNINLGSDNYMNEIWGPGSWSVSDSGWGQSGGDCSSFTYQEEGDLPTRDCKHRNYTNASSGSGYTVAIHKARSTSCEAGLKRRIRSADAILRPSAVECWKPAVECCDVKGNPTALYGRSKMETAVDYQGAGPGALEYMRYYNSQGYFESELGLPRLASYKDYWRNTYSRRIIPLASHASLMAVYLKPSGGKIHFDSTGTESNKFSRAGYTLSHTVGIGYTLAKPSGGEETYDEAGRLLTITTNSGLSQTITYDLNGNMATVTDHFGRQLVFLHNEDDLLVSITLPDGISQIGYGYNGADHLQSVTNPDGETLVYHYNNSRKWLLTGITDEENQRFSTYVYNSDGNVISTEHAGGVYKYQFKSPYTNPGGNQYRAFVTDPAGRKSYYAYDERNGVQRLIYVREDDTGYHVKCADCGPYKDKGYTGSGFLSWVRDWNNWRTNFVYDQTRNLEIQRTEGLDTNGGATINSRTISTSWHPTLRKPATITEPSGVSGIDRVTAYQYDGQGNRTQKTITAGALVREWNWTYDSLGRLLTENGPRTDVNDSSTYTYYSDFDACINCRGQLHTVSNARNHVSSFDDYNAYGKATQVTDPRGVVTTITYNYRGQPLMVTDNGGADGVRTSTNTYYKNGLLKTAENPDGSSLTYTYHASKILDRVTDNQGNYIVYGHDNYKNITSEQTYDPLGMLKLAVQSVYNNQNRLESMTTGVALPSTTEYTYNGNGAMKTVQNPRLNTTTNTYDSLDRVRTVNHPQSQGGNTVYTYDQQDQVTKVAAPNGAKTEYGYDGLGNVIWEDSPDRGISLYGYDEAGNITCKVDGRHATSTTQVCETTPERITFIYDALNRMTEATYHEDPSLDTIYSWDSWGGSQPGVLGAVRHPGRDDFIYAFQDTFGNVGGHWDYLDTGAGYVESLTTYYEYDNGVALESIEYPKGEPGQADSWVVTYGRDSMGRISTITAAKGGVSKNIVTNVSYEAFGPVGGVTYGNGVTQTYSYDDAYQMTQWLIEQSGGADLDQWDYSHDENGNITQLRKTGPVNTTLPYAYDEMDRMTTDNTFSYAYDANGNVDGYGNGSIITYQTDPDEVSNQMISYGSNPVVYDGMGNLESSGGPTFSFDAAGRLVTIDNGREALVNTYNGKGERTTTIRTEGPEESYVEFFSYAPDGRVLSYTSSQHVYSGGEVVGLGTRYVVNYVWLDSKPVAQIRETYNNQGVLSSTEVTYLHTDNLNTPRRGTNDAGLISWRLWSSAYGMGWEASDPDGDGVGTWVMLRFPGQMAYYVAGINYNYYRDYDSMTGRYIESDPVGLRGGTNTYAYVQGNPLSFYDPLGLFLCGDWGWMAFDWATGFGSRDRSYGPMSDQVAEMRKLPPINKAIDFYKNKNAEELSDPCCDESKLDSVTGYDGDFGLNEFKWATSNKSCAWHYVGSFAVNVYPVSCERVKIVLTNNSSFKSATYGQLEAWEGGAGGNLRQTYQWEQDL
jgi:RHS repeat-associated protein